MGKTIKELVFKDNFMFAAVMLDEDIAKGVLERALDIPIERVEVSYEKSIVYNPEYKGVRLDVYIKDGRGRHFDVEMQVANEKILKRARYYHSQIDTELLLTGMEYEKLPDSYVIFICDFDPIGLGKYKYTRKQVIAEEPSYEYNDGSHTVSLSTKGTNDDEVSESLRKFLKFAGANKPDSSADYEDEFVAKLQKSIEKIRNDRNFGRQYMLLEEMMNDKFKAGKAAGMEEGKKEGEIETRKTTILDLLALKGSVSDNLKQKVSSIEDIETAQKLYKCALTVSSCAEFEQEFDRMKL